MNKGEYSPLLGTYKAKRLSWKGFKYPLFVIITLVFAISQLFIIKRNPRSIFDYSIYQNIHLQSEYDTIGVPTLNPSTEHLHQGVNGMVSSDVPLCSRLGTDILKRGGNAADAAITVSLCIGSIYLQSSGIGGGGFILSTLSNGDAISIDAREMAPAKSFKEMYLRNPHLSQVGGLAIGVPGELKGLYELYSRHGSRNLSWYDLFVPVIELNRNGFECSFIFERSIDLVMQLGFSVVPVLKNDWDYIFNEDGSQVTAGQIIRRNKLADTLEIIGKNGSSDIFYDPNGPIASSLVKKAHQYGGIIELEDFANYHVNVDAPLTLDLTIKEKKYKVFTTNGVSSGLALLAGLNFFSNVYDEDTSDMLEVHKIIESMKWMASARSHFGDFSLNKTKTEYGEELVNKYTSADWVQDIIRAGNYSDEKTFPWEHYQPKFQLTEPHGTTHFSVVDKDGNTVGMTSTVNLIFGSLVYDNKTGIVLNNQMDDFSSPNTPNAFNLSPSVFNFVEPFKRPISSTAPTVVFSETESGEFYPDLLIGAAGGSRITTAIFQAIIRVLYNKLPLLETISFPRIHHQLIPEYVSVENFTVFDLEHNQDNAVSVSILETLHNRFGHNFSETGPLSAMNAIKRNDSSPEGFIWEGVSDYWRKLGEAAGY